MDGLRAQSRRLVIATVNPARREKAGVEEVEILHRELVQRYGAESGHDMPLDVAPVGVERAPTEPRLLHGQPTVEQVRPKCDPLADDRVAFVASLDEVSEQLLGVASPGAGRHPAAAVLARRRIGAIVNDGVPTLALLRDASARRRLLPHRGKGRLAATWPDPRASDGMQRCCAQRTTDATRRSTSRSPEPFGQPHRAATRRSVLPLRPCSSRRVIRRVALSRPGTRVTEWLR